MRTDAAPLPLKEQFSRGLDAPICLTWELTYACNLACVHCLSSSGRRDPRELTPSEARAVVDELAAMQVFYVNIGGGEPMLRPDFFDLVGYAVDRGVGVKFSTNGTRITPERARQLAAMEYLDVQVSIDGATVATNDAVRGNGSFAAARRAMDNLAAAGFGAFKISVVVTRHNVVELDALAALADSYGAQLRLTRLRPSGRGQLGRPASDRGTAARALLLAVRASRHPDRGLVLPPLRPRRTTRGAEPVRCGPGGVPHRPDRRRLRLPVRHRPPVPGRQRARRRRLPRGVAHVGALLVAARAAERRRLRLVWLLRRLPRRVHGGQVLHRTTARRPGPRVRARPR